MMNHVYLLTGSNQGNRMQLLQQCNTMVAERIGNVIASSKIYETASWGNESLPEHLNQALLVETFLPPMAILTQIHEIEKVLGRQRNEKWGLRTIDIDIIFFNEEVIQTKALIIPHPLLQERNFALKPMAEIARKYIHPVLHKNVGTLLKESKDMLEVKIFSAGH